MRPTVLDGGDEKRLAWSSLDRPSLQDVMDAVNEQYPGVPLNQLFVQELLIIGTTRGKTKQQAARKKRG